MRYLEAIPIACIAVTDLQIRCDKRNSNSVTRPGRLPQARNEGK
jgi:hypothetical protein